jgi:hypothetical protein
MSPTIHMSGSCTIVAQLLPNRHLSPRMLASRSNVSHWFRTPGGGNGQFAKPLYTPNVHRGFESTRFAMFGWPTYEVMHFEGSA